MKKSIMSSVGLLFACVGIVVSTSGRDEEDLDMDLFSDEVQEKIPSLNWSSVEEIEKALNEGGAHMSEADTSELMAWFGDYDNGDESGIFASEAVVPWVTETKPELPVVAPAFPESPQSSTVSAQQKLVLHLQRSNKSEGSRQSSTVPPPKQKLLLSTQTTNKHSVKKHGESVPKVNSNQRAFNWVREHYDKPLVEVLRLWDGEPSLGGNPSFRYVRNRIIGVSNLRILPKPYLRIMQSILATEPTADSQHIARTIGRRAGRATTLWVDIWRTMCFRDKACTEQVPGCSEEASIGLGNGHAVEVYRMEDDKWRSALSAYEEAISKERSEVAVFELYVNALDGETDVEEESDKTPPELKRKGAMAESLGSTTGGVQNPRKILKSALRIKTASPTNTDSSLTPTGSTSSSEPTKFA